LNANNNEIIFTSGATESINFVFKGLVNDDFSNHHIITVKTEHKAILETCSYLESRGVQIDYLDVDRSGIINVETLQKVINSKTTILAIHHVNNEIGVKQPIKEIGKICQRDDILFFVDAAQSFGKIPIDVKEISIDFLAISGHKMYGPKGVGALFCSENYISSLTPLLHGGGQESGSRSGSLNVPGIVGLGKAVEIAVKELNKNNRRVKKYFDIILDSLGDSKINFKINGSIENRYQGNLNLCIPGVTNDWLIHELSDYAISVGSACDSDSIEPSHVLRAIGLNEQDADCSIRISYGRFTSESEILKFSKDLIIGINKFNSLREKIVRI